MYYNSLSDMLKKRFGKKVYRLSLSAGCTCPNRDGTLGTRGCIFCDGAGAFAAEGSISRQYEEAKARVGSKTGKDPAYIAYFQPFTNTYGDPERLREIFLEAAERDDTVAVSIATRPDCLPDAILRVLEDVMRVKPVWVELGLQTIFAETAKYIRRGYDLPVYDKAVQNLREIGAEVIVHQILGLPGETPEMMAETSEYIGRSGADGIKLQLLHILRGTDLEEEWRSGRVSTMEMDEYIRALEMCVEALPARVVIHRMTGDGDKRTLLAPMWSADKKRVLNAINRAFTADDVVQGRKYIPQENRLRT